MLQAIFKFGDFWDTLSVVFYISIGMVVSLLCKKGSNYNFINHKKQEAYNIFYGAALLVLIFIYTFRDGSVGSDAVAYIEFFEKAEIVDVKWTELFLFTQMEPLFLLTNYLLRSITEHYTVLFLFYGVIISFAYIEFIKDFWSKNSDYVFLIGFVVGFVYSFTAMRSSMAMAFILFSLCSLRKEHYFKAILLTFAGALYHFTAIVNFPLIVFYYLSQKSDRKYNQRLIFFSTLLFSGAILILGSLKSFLLTTKYHSYAETSGNSFLGNWPIILSVLIAIWLIRHGYSKNRDNLICITCSLYTGVLLIPSIYLGAYRLTTFYELPNLFLFGLIGGISDPEKDDRRKIYMRKLLFLVMILFYCLYIFGRRSNTGGFEYSFAPLF